MKIIVISIFAASLFLVSCNNSESSTPTEQVVTAEHEGHHHDSEHEAIELNNGEKWKVNEDMMVHIVKMEKDISSFKGSSIAEYKTLAVSIDKDLDLLTSSCTMEGKAHDELHKWLLPFIETAEELLESETAEEASTHYKEIQKSIATFNTYFK